MNWGAFAWAAGFAGISGALRLLQQALAKTERLTGRDAAVMSVDVLTVAFWGGLTGWIVSPVVPEYANELLAVTAATGGWYGRRFLTGIVLRALRVQNLLEQAEER